MLSYRHAFHAGNDADVVKHIALIALFGALTRKDKPFLYLETHGGAGTYDLRKGPAGSTQEAADGIGLLWQADVDGAPPALTDYLALVRRFNGSGALRRYPGSPWLARQLLRPDDRALLAELHPADHPRLARLMRDEPRIRVLHQDGYDLLRSALPPLEKRALVFIDPAYEGRDEPRRLHRALAEGQRRFGHGVYAVWYPVGGKHHADLIVEQITRAARARPSKTLDLRWTRGGAPERAGGGTGLQGCGLAILNPPFGLDETLRVEIDFAVRLLEPAVRRPDLRLNWPVP